VTPKLTLANLVIAYPTLKKERRKKVKERKKRKKDKIRKIMG
jgi:hypothetical protein